MHYSNGHCGPLRRPVSSIRIILRSRHDPFEGLPVTWMLHTPHIYSSAASTVIQISENRQIPLKPPS